MQDQQRRERRDGQIRQRQGDAQAGRRGTHRHAREAWRRASVGHRASGKRRRSHAIKRHATAGSETLTRSRRELEWGRDECKARADFSALLRFLTIEARQRTGAESSSLRGGGPSIAIETTVSPRRMTRPSVRFCSDGAEALPSVFCFLF